MHRSSLTLGLVALALASGGCDQLTATTQAVSVLTASPDLASADGFDSNLTGLVDLNALPTSGIVGVAVGVAEKDSATSTKAPTPIDGALVHVSWDTDTGTQEAALCGASASQPGTYAAANIEVPDFGGCADANLAYLPGTTYTTTIETSSAEHTIKVVAPPAIIPGDVAFTPALDTTSPIAGLALKGHALNEPLTVDWSGSPDAGDRHAFVTVVRINFTGDSADPQSVLTDTNWSADSSNPVFNSAPTDPSQMIDLVINPPETSVDIPATAFSQTGLYFLVVTTAELSTDVSSNLAIGSGGLAGKGTAFVFFVN